MRASPALCERFTPHRRQWAGLGERLRRSVTVSNPTTNLVEHPATPLGQPAPSFRRFKPASHFSIFKLNELQRSVDNAAAYKLVFFTPLSVVKSVKDAIFATGAGTLHGGLYSRCCFQTIGTSQYLPEIGAMASSARNIGRVEVVEEVKVEIMCQGRAQVREAVRALLHAHPHDAPVYEVIKLEHGFLPSQISLPRAKEDPPAVSRKIDSNLPSSTGALLPHVKHRINNRFSRAPSSSSKWPNPNSNSNSKPKVSYRLVLIPPRDKTDKSSVEANEREIERTPEETQQKQDVDITTAETAEGSGARDPPAAPPPRDTGEHDQGWLERAKQASSQVRGLHTRSSPPIDRLAPSRSSDTEGQRAFREGLDDLMAQIDNSAVFGRPRDVEGPAAAAPEPSSVPTISSISPPNPNQQAAMDARPQFYQEGPKIEAPEEFFARLKAAHRPRDEPKTMRELLDKIIARLQPVKPTIDAQPAKKNRHYNKRKRTN
ncbi:hypothetical protein TWF696_002867 [Orbilia brochopaga]|uniref:ATP phosphoribosyltransferase n=1 Tax=Orbilia brochopaga TaxID=3140254 RepID=A0AAV9U295_9PEZI